MPAIDVVVSPDDIDRPDIWSRLDAHIDELKVQQVPQHLGQSLTDGPGLVTRPDGGERREGDNLP
jgi:hypothetical protein